MEPLKKLKDEGYSIEGFFFNPNIQPFGEYLQRMNALNTVIRDEKINLSVPAYNVADQQDVFFGNNLEIRPERCKKCYKLRLKRTAEHAKANHIKVFSTTLLGSPYQDHEVINELGGALAAEYSLEFLTGRNWHVNYRAGRDKARAMDLHIQKYCGCIYSRAERIEKKPAT
jgi:predicted adenine nucleotide alpha hydrolase (AANH) superfamily ATPase